MKPQRINQQHKIWRLSPKRVLAAGVYRKGDCNFRSPGHTNAKIGL